jgi:hypothetical protein
VTLRNTSFKTQFLDLFRPHGLWLHPYATSEEEEEEEKGWVYLKQG